MSGLGRVLEASNRPEGGSHLPGGKVRAGADPIAVNLGKQFVFLEAAAASLILLLCQPYQGREGQSRLMWEWMRQLELLGEGTSRHPGLQLVEKQTDPDDRRNRWVAISEKGRNLLYEIDMILARKIAQSIDKVGKGEAPDGQS